MSGLPRWLPHTAVRAHDVPADHSCFFHAVAAHVGISAPVLRRAVATAVARAPHAPLHGASLADWIAWEHDGASASAYATAIAAPTAWGGAFELALLAHLLARAAAVYAPGPRGWLQRITDVPPPPPPQLPPHGGTPPPIVLLYVGSSHYMPLFAAEPRLAGEPCLAAGAAS